MDGGTLQAGQAFGPYTIVRQLGQGGMGAVWLALQPSLNRQVALKVMAPALANDAEFIARFRREGLTAAGLNHPHIVSVFDLGETDGLLYLCLEYVPGEPLSELIKRGDPIRPGDVARWGAEIAGALLFAHERGVLHRDVKPGNVLIDPGHHARLMDFGLAKHVDATTLTTSGLLGTPYYMAPEFGEGRPADARSDQYALGVMLYELLTGHVPFWGASPVSVLYQHMHSTPRHVRDHNPDVPAALADAVMRAMSREPADRFSSCGALADALRPMAIAEDPTPTPLNVGSSPTLPVGSGTPPTPGVSTGTGEVPSAPVVAWVRRHRLLVGGLTAAALVAAFFLAGRALAPPVPSPASPLVFRDAGSADSPVAPSQAQAGAVPLPEPATLPPPAVKAPPVWEEASPGVLDARGGFVEDFARRAVALRLPTVRGAVRVTRPPGQLRVVNDGDAYWRAHSLRAVRVARCELTVQVDGGGPGQAGFFVQSPSGGDGVEVTVDAARTVRLWRTTAQAARQEVGRHVLSAESAGTPVRLTLVAGPQGVRVQADAAVVRSWDSGLRSDGLVGLVARGPVTATFDRFVVRARE